MKALAGLVRKYETQKSKEHFKYPANPYHIESLLHVKIKTEQNACL